MTRSTEYTSSYSRSLWTETARSNYFALAEETKWRKLRSTNHEPIHWELDETKDADFIQLEAERERKKEKPISTELEHPTNKVAWGGQTNFLSKDVSVQYNCESDEINSDPTKQRTSSAGNKTPPGKSPTDKIIGSKLTPELSKSVSEYNYKSDEIYPDPTRLRPSTAHTRSKDQPGKSPTEKIIRSKITPELRKPASPIKSSPVHVGEGTIEDYKYKAPTPNTYVAQCIDDKIAKPPFAMYGNATSCPGTGVRQTYNVKPKSKEVYSSALRAKNGRARLQLYRKTIDKNKYETVPKPKKKGVLFNTFIKDNWVTEYQGNFKKYVY